MGMGGRLQAGGPSANNQITYNLHTLDAKSMLEYFKENPNLAGNILMTGMTDSGIAAIGSQQAFNSTYGGYILPGGLTA